MESVRSGVWEVCGRMEQRTIDRFRISWQPLTRDSTIDALSSSGSALRRITSVNSSEPLNERICAGRQIEQAYTQSAAGKQAGSCVRSIERDGPC